MCLIMNMENYFWCARWFHTPVGKTTIECDKPNLLHLKCSAKLVKQKSKRLCAKNPTKIQALVRPGLSDWLISADDAAGQVPQQHHAGWCCGWKSSWCCFSSWSWWRSWWYQLMLRGRCGLTDYERSQHSQMSVANTLRIIIIFRYCMLFTAKI